MRTLLMVAVVALLSVPALAADPAALLAQIKQVGKEGQGNPEAAKAWQELTKAGPGALIATLAALDDANPAAANFLRSAVDAIAERELTAGRPLPADKLEAFVKDTQRNPQARRLAYELLVKVDPKTPARLLPTMLNDPSVELRRDAVAVVLQGAQDALDKGDKAAAKTGFEKALATARDRDQIDQCAARLQTLGVQVDLPAHFGFVQKWQVIGPFDSTGGIGFKAVYPPEKGVNLAATYPGKGGAVIAWKEGASEPVKDKIGQVDFNKIIGKHMGAVGYAFTVIESAGAQPVEIRASSNNAIRIFLNGTEVFFREEYHHGDRFDGMVAKVTLRAGKNEILVKVCQNEQKDAWAQRWDFQLRLSDAVGGAVPFKVVAGKQ